MNPDIGYGNDSYGGGRVSPDDDSSTKKPLGRGHRSHRGANGRDVEKDASSVYSPAYDQSSSSKGPNGLKKSFVNFGAKLSKGNPEQDEKATQGTQQRMKQDLRELKQLRKDQDQQIDELKTMLRENEDKSNKLKRRNEKLQAQIDSDESTLGHQQPDEVVLSQFRSLIGSIKNWAAKWFSGSPPHDVGFDFDWSIDGDFKAIQSILPYVKNKEDFASFVTDVRKRRKFVRGWVGLHVAKDIFRTLPAAVNLYPFPQELGSDIWIPAVLRAHVDEIELALLNSGDSTTLNEFNQWRSLTMSLLFKKYPGISEETTRLVEESARHALQPILSALPRADREPAKQKLIENVYKPALELSQLLRRQRALWSVRFPYANYQSRNGTNTAVFNEVFMKDTEDQEDEDESGRHDARTLKWVDIVVTPLLYKSGTIDGKQYDVENVVERAEVFCAPSNQQY
ncbi:hypothetical protein O1611_g2289 [Lasiodiplodia mahajangana]|uniref:Uncharacterized protein n=1 Tax=Lasiodiplodia mahajangana TaxID=1108764 RepID=A0ACC2JVP7_9PEZI|nr:hypothetical protein O1611_g2289 [Lasiodiplodia mahajangana]